MTRLVNAVHFEWTFVPLADASTSHVWVYAGVECKLLPHTPISNKPDARDMWAYYVNVNVLQCNS
jgi:hypothetical protein